MLRINHISIDTVGPIKHLELKFDNNFNIICGQNGVGKTTILDCLAQSFSIQRITVKKKVDSISGEWVTSIASDETSISKKCQVDAFHPYETFFADGIQTGIYEKAQDIIVFKTHRNIPYKKLNSVTSDADKDSSHFTQETLTGSLPDDLKSWFVNRYLFSAQRGNLSNNQIKNFELAKECFSFLNPEIKFSKVDSSSFDILLETNAGEIYFEYLSSGYKSCLAVLLGLVREVELRYKYPNKFIKDFDGIVFIDEIDLHLHPEWQAKIYETIKLILPSAQIFTTTHSPHIIQIASPNEIIALTFDENGDVIVNPLPNYEFGFQGWTVEEILKDVMGMEETRTVQYKNEINGFNDALENENFELAKKHYDTLEKMLHPENSLRKILKIQLTGIKEND